jgi:hypothetical protein
MTTPSYQRFSFFEADRQKREEGVVLNLLEQAKKLSDKKAGWNYFQQALMHLKEIYDRNPNDPVVIRLVSTVRSAVWADIRERPSLQSKVDNKTFEALLTPSSFEKFRDHYGSHSQSLPNAKPDNQ